MILKDSTKNIKENKLERLLTLSNLLKNKEKKILPKLSLKNISNNNSKENIYRAYDTMREKEKIMDNLKNIILHSNKSKKKQNIIEKKAKEIFLLKSTGEKIKKVKIYKTEKKIINK